MRTFLTALALTAATAWPAVAQTATDMGAAVPPSASTPSAPAGPGGYGAHGGGGSPEMRAARHAAREQCAADIARLCPDVAAMAAQPPPADGSPAGGPSRRAGGMFQCVRQHVSELSSGCRQAIDAMRAARGAPGGAPPAPSAPQG